ncbi:hypothetical protein [Modicisalibacter luteus]|uniref:hypothetical protein n=1 Tax=Modicisalibacter luteus TaxID=453962 RepID=UPI003642A674
MKSRYPRRAMALVAALLMSLPVVADEASDRAMREALEAARNREWSRINDSVIEDHVLAGYVEYHRLRSQLPHVTPEIINGFLQRHADSPLSDWMRGVAQVSYGNAKRYDALLAVSDGKPRGTIRQCYYYTALLDRDPPTAAQGGLDLWLTGRSQPSECDTLFDTLLNRGVIDSRAIWQRMMLAWENGEDGLMSYLAKKLPASWSDAQQALDRLKGDYAGVTRVPVDLGPQGQASAALFTAAMYNFTRADTEAALEAWRKIGPHLSLNDEQRHSVEHDLAFYSLVREIDNNRGGSMTCCHVWPMVTCLSCECAVPSPSATGATLSIGCIRCPTIRARTRAGNTGWVAHWSSWVMSKRHARPTPRLRTNAASSDSRRPTSSANPTLST